MRALLERVAAGEGSRVMSELNRLTNPSPITREISGIRCIDFASKVIAVGETRRKEEAKAAEAKRQRDAETRRQRLDSVLQRADTLWADLDSLMDQKSAAAYQQVAAQLFELRDAHEQAGQSARFQQKLTVFREHYSRRTGMLRRIEPGSASYPAHRAVHDAPRGWVCLPAIETDAIEYSRAIRVGRFRAL